MQRYFHWLSTAFYTTTTTTVLNMIYLRFHYRRPGITERDDIYWMLGPANVPLCNVTVKQVKVYLAEHHFHFDSSATG